MYSVTHEVVVLLYFLDVNECRSNPCLHGGMCLNKPNEYECDCPHGWEGVNCEHEKGNT